MIQRVKDDTSSLYVERGSTSLHSRVSRCTDTLSRISQSFEFDRELFISKVYERVVRASLKDTMRRSKNDMVSGSTPTLASTFKAAASRSNYSVNYTRSSTIFTDSKLRNDDIEKQLEVDSRRLRSECKVPVFGDENLGKVFLKQSKHLHGGGFTTTELHEYKEVIRECVWHIVNTMNTVVGEATLEMDATMKGHADVLSREIQNSTTGHAIISAEAAVAVKRLWGSEQFSTSLQLSLPDSTE